MHGIQIRNSAPASGSMTRSLLHSTLRGAMITVAVMCSWLVASVHAATPTEHAALLSTIHVTTETDAQIAHSLLTPMSEHYDIKPTITRDQNSDKLTGPGLYIGRGAALASGLISANELDAVREDGFVMSGDGGRVALAGHGEQGTTYAVVAWLRRLGVRYYPGVGHQVFTTFTPQDELQTTFRESHKPFFAMRDAREHIGRGRFGETIRNYSLANPAQIAEPEWFKKQGWLGWDHTAGYLVPLAQYHEDHPEYFAVRRGKRLTPDTIPHRTNLCLTNPEVHRISTQRALKWIEQQQERQFFMLSDGDSKPCECEQCLAQMAKPGDHTDTQLAWVNSIANGVYERFPDKTMLALAYIQSAEPPSRVKVAKNVVVMYCPWFWTSQYSSSVSWTHPGNVTAMRQFMGWVTQNPGRIGIYDYPGSFAASAAQRIKFFAKHGVRVYYGNSLDGPRTLWVITQLIWDPTRNADDLSDEFIDAYYGPAATTMKTYYAMSDAAEFKHGRAVWEDRAFVETSTRLLKEAAGQANDASPEEQLRIRDSVSNKLQELLRRTFPTDDKPGLAADYLMYQQRLADYLALHPLLLANYQNAGNRYALTQYTKLFEKVARAIGLSLPKGGVMPAARASILDADRRGEDQEVNEASGSAGEHTLPWNDGPAAVAAAATNRFKEQSNLYPATGSSPEIITFTDPGVWEMSRAKNATTAIAVDQIPAGDMPAGLAFTVPVSHGVRGWMLATLPEPLDIKKRFFIDVHLTASTTVPVALVVGNLQGDFALRAGEQIIRMDLRNSMTPDEFNAWDGQLKKIQINVFPQHYPTPPVDAVELRVYSITATGRDPEPVSSATRPAIWLTAFRPNLELKLPGPGGITRERFRTFTTHRTLAPMRRIVIASGEAGDRQAAEVVQNALAAAWGVRLPIENVTSDSEGNIIIGKKAALAAKAVSDDALDYAGPHGFIIDAADGRIVIAGGSAEATLAGVECYLADHGLLADAIVRTPASKDKFLHEIYFLDMPHFDVTLAPLTPNAAQGTPQEATLFAKAIRNCALREIKPDQTLLNAATSSALNHAVAKRLFWDPFASITDLLPGQ